MHLDGFGGCLVEWIDGGGLDKDLSPGNEEERLRRYSETEVSELGDRLLSRRMNEEW